MELCFELYEIKEFFISIWKIMKIGWWMNPKMGRMALQVT